MSNILGVAGVQMKCVPWNMEATLDVMEERLGALQSGFPWVSLVCFPEYCPIGVTSFAPWNIAYTNSLKNPQTYNLLCERFSGMAKKYKVWLQPGSFYEVEGQSVYNTAPVFSPGGELVAKYRKIFPWRPHEHVDHGRDFCVFDIPGKGRIGLCICYDAWYPEVIRSLMWLGAEVILHPTLTNSCDRPLELVIEQAHALQNQCYMVNTNGALPTAMGRSVIVDPSGTILVQAGECEQFLTAILDFDLVRRVRRVGTLGLSQTLKQLRDTDIKFHMYDDIRKGRVFEDLDELKMPGADDL